MYAILSQEARIALKAVALTPVPCARPAIASDFQKSLAQGLYLSEPILPFYIDMTIP